MTETTLISLDSSNTQIQWQTQNISATMRALDEAVVVLLSPTD